uniref:Uncharacterized protein n=1 Tax=Rhizophora mucronata TaxID=61149 RepID=A0A2P2QVH7_RHIMU
MYRTVDVLAMAFIQRNICELLAEQG